MPDPGKKRLRPAHAGVDDQRKKHDRGAVHSITPAAVQFTAPMDQSVPLLVRRRVSDSGAIWKRNAAPGVPRANVKAARNVPAWATTAIRPPREASASNAGTLRRHRSAKLSPPGERWAAKASRVNVPRSGRFP